MRAWYEQFYSKEWDQQGRRLVKGHEKRVKPKRSALDFCADHLTSGANVLDVGAGFGAILLAFKERGYNVYGLERSEHRAMYVRDVLGIPCSRSPIESFTPPTEPGLICMNHVLEHVSDPAQVIALLAAMLPEGGMVYIAVPDFWRGEYPPQTFHFVPHLSSFTVKALSRLFTKHGLHLVRVREEKDIQVLAVKGGTASLVEHTSDAASRAAFWARTSASVLDAFGNRAGHHTLVWFENPGQPRWTYQRHVFSGSRLMARMLRLAVVNEPRLERALPAPVRQRVRRLLPNFLTSRKTRMLSVHVRGDMSLAVHITHPNGQAPVWIK